MVEVVDVDRIVAAALERRRERVKLEHALPAPARCRALRRKAGLSAPEVAAAVGSNYWNVWNWETNVCLPTGDVLARYVGLMTKLAAMETSETA